MLVLSIPSNSVANVGAGVIPFAVVAGETRFLFQRVFSGRKTAHLIDFGGGMDPGESKRDCAIREFIEETETMYLADDPLLARRTEASVNRQIPILASLFEMTLAKHPEWWCNRSSGNATKPKDWVTYFIEVPYKDPAAMNQAWEDDSSGRYKKRRELVWIAADELLNIYASNPERLWKRVRQLEGAPEVIRQIHQATQP